MMLVIYLTLAALVVSLLLSGAQFARLVPEYESEWDRGLGKGDGLAHRAGLRCRQPGQHA